MTQKHTKTGVARRFSSAAKTYDDAAHVQRVASAKVAEMLAHLSEPAQVLEIGCGTGLLTQSLRVLFPEARIHAVDISEGMIQCAKSEFSDDKKILWSVADAAVFDTPQHFQLAVSSCSLHWITPLESVFANTARLLDPNSPFVFAMMLNGSLKELHEAREAVVPHKRPPGRLAEKSEVLTALDNTGFQIVSAQSESVETTHPNAKELLRTLSKQGVTGGHVSSGPSPLTAGEIRNLISYYDEHYPSVEGGVKATYHVLYVQALQSVT